MRNPRIELSSVISRIDLYDNEFINIFVNGAKPQDELNNIEIFVRDGVLHVVVNENLIDTVVLTTYEEEYK